MTDDERAQEAGERIKNGFLPVLPPMDCDTEGARPADGFKQPRRQKAAAVDLSKLDRLPPNSPEAEQGVLGCCLLSPNDSVPFVAEKTRGAAEVFYDLRHQTLFTELAAMSGAREPIDLITVQQRLKDANQLESVGGLAYLSGLMDAVPSAANLAYYLDIVREKWTLRRLAQVCTQTLGRIHQHEGEVAQLVDAVTRDILAVSEADGPAVAVLPVQHYVKAALDVVEQHVQGRKLMLGLSTGINYLDNMTSGLQAHQLWLLCGRPGGGKTSLAMQIGTFVAVDLRQPVGVFSLEMDGVTLALRELCGRGQSSFQAFRNGFCDEQMGRRLVIAAHAFGRDPAKGLPPAPLYIDESDELFCEDLERRVEQMHREHGIKVFVIDYLQLLEGRRGFRYSGENLVMAMSHVSASLRKLKKRLPVTLLVAAQENTNREKAERPRPPLLSDLADGQGAAKAADLVAFLDDINLAHVERDLRSKDEDKRDAAEAQMQWLRSGPVLALPAELRGDDKHQDTFWKHHLKRTNLHIAKQRNGPTGACQLVMVKPWMRFLDVRVTQEEAVRRAGQGSRRGETAEQEKLRLLDEAAGEMGAGN